MTHPPGFVGFDDAGRFVHYCFCGAWGAHGFSVNRKADPPELGRWYCGEHKHMGDSDGGQPEARNQRKPDSSSEGTASERGSDQADQDQGEGGRPGATVQAKQARPIITFPQPHIDACDRLVARRLEILATLPGWRRSTDDEDDKLGARAEMGAFLYLKPVKWNAIFPREQVEAGEEIPDFHDFIDAKGIRRSTDHMIIPCDGQHNKDLPIDHHAYLCVGCWDFPTVTICGWLWGREIRERYRVREQWHRGRWRYGRWVPQRDLRDAQSLIPILRQAQRDRPLD